MNAFLVECPCGCRWCRWNHGFMRGMRKLWVSSRPMLGLVRGFGLVMAFVFAVAILTRYL